ncbi:MAG: hypothetical protein J6T80_05365 [Paludibacteraceae bacterium]|nr:hypothetical protein [Paludibacteraceae bacterium]
MNHSATLLSAFLQKYPNLEQLSDERLRSALADIFGNNKDVQKMAFDLIREGKFEEMSAPKPSTLQVTLTQPLSKAEKQKLLDAHPAMPYPQYTLWENIRDYFPKVWDEIISRALLVGGVIGGPTYLLTLLFKYFDIGNWNIYVWCTYGAIMLVLLCLIIKDSNGNFDIQQKREDYKQERLQKIIAQKGYTKNAEQMMYTIYEDIRLHKDQYNYQKREQMLESAYANALVEILCYFEKDDRWFYLEAKNPVALRDYAYLYRKYYGYKAFNPYDDYGHVLLGEKPMPTYEFPPGPTFVAISVPASIYR